MFPLNLLGLLTNPATLMLLLGGVLGGFAGNWIGEKRGIHAGKEMGRQEIVAAVNRDNAAAAVKAREAASAIERCDADGGEWDIDKWACINAEKKP